MFLGVVGRLLMRVKFDFCSLYGFQQLISAEQFVPLRLPHFFNACVRLLPLFVFPLFFVFPSAEPCSTVAVSYSCFCQQAFITSDIVKSTHVPGAKDNGIKQSSTLCCDSGKQFEVQWPKGRRIRW